MKKKHSVKKAVAEPEIPETDFSKGARGKYAAAMKKNGYTIRVYRADGRVDEKRVLGESLVSLDPDVQAYFPDSRAVNSALRKLSRPSIRLATSPCASDVALLNTLPEKETRGDAPRLESFGRSANRSRRTIAVLFIAWIEIHQEDLRADWDLAVNGKKPFPIKGLDQ